MKTETTQLEGVAFIRATAPYERDDTIPSLFARTALEHAGRTAVESGHARLTYAELHEQALGIAAALSGLGVAAGDTVAILCERSVDVPAAMLGVLFADAVFVPLDPRAPLPRNARIADLAGCRVVVTNVPTVPAGLTALRLSEVEPQSRCNGNGARDHVCQAGSISTRAATDAASIMFTSGSTGEPKGVLIPHRAIVRLCRNNWFCRADTDTRFLHISSLAFDASTLELWAPLLNGGCVVVAPEGALGLREIADTICRHNATTCFLTPVLFNALVDECPGAFEPLRAVYTGGEVASPRHFAKLRSAFPRLSIVHAYGPTENTTFTTCQPIEHVDEAAPLPIGRPISNTGVCIVDEHLRPVCTGDLGELVATGDGLALGYFQNPEETAKRFVDLPQIGVVGYRTGDRARMRDDGVIEFHGRLDDQVKIRGNRVEPGEVEAFLRLVPDIRDAAVVVARGEHGRQALHAFVVAESRTGWPALEARLMRRMRAALPECMVPATLARRVQLPVGPTGKVDRARLRDQVEKGHLVASCWRALLPDVDASDGACLGTLALLLSRAWHPYESETVLLSHGESTIDLSSVGTDGTVESVLRAVERALGQPHARDVVAEIRTPEGAPAWLVAGDDLRLRLPASTSDELITWRLEHVRNIVDCLRQSEAAGGAVAAHAAGPDERRRIEADWNNTRWDHGIARTLVELFEDVAARNPAREAVRSEELSISYRHLLHRSNAVAMGLEHYGIGPGDRVGIWDDRSVEAIVGVLGILRCGAVCVPLDLVAPAARVRATIQDAQVRAVLASARAPAPDHGVPTLPISAGEEPHMPAGRPTLHSDAFVLFTSGSTGRPKGVPIRHESLVNRIAWMHRRFGLDERDLVLQKNRLTWDVSIWEYLWPLAFGGRCLVASGATAGDPVRLHEFVRTNGVTVLHLVPSLVVPFARAARNERTEVRLTVCSGEALSTAAAREYLDAVGGDLYNLYGPTEAAIDVTCAACAPEDEVVTIGRPVENTRISITDREGSLCPIGVMGELRISGVQVSRGYCEAPGVSSEPFAPDSSGVGWSSYRTGDLGRWREDGMIEFVGRADAQIKLCGFRIEPGEIEAALAQHAQVAEACVCKVGEGLEAELVAVCVRTPGCGAVDESGVREHLRAVLESSSVPTRTVWVDAMPRLANGKIDRRAVRSIAAHHGRESADGGSARAIVSSVWSMLLGSAPGSDSANFVHSGGNSLTLLRLMLEVERRLGVEVAAAPAMAEPTFERIVATIEAVRSDSGRGSSSGLRGSSSSAGDLMRLTYGSTPLVVFPHLGGTLGFLNDVLPHVAGELAVYGARARGMFDGEKPLDTVEAMVEGYADLVLAQSWRRPCLLGFSSGTILAMGVANRLLDRGIKVPLLVLVDSSLNITARGRAARLFNRCVQGAVRIRGGRDRLGEHVSEHQRLLMAAHLRALRNHRPSTYAGRVLVLASRASRRSHSLSAWRSVVRGPADEVLVDAGHMAMWRAPHARILAEVILQRVRPLSFYEHDAQARDSEFIFERPEGSSPSGGLLADSVNR